MQSSKIKTGLFFLLAGVFSIAALHSSGAYDTDLWCVPAAFAASPTSRGTPSHPAETPCIPPELASVLCGGDPASLADTSLPRLSELSESEIIAITEAISSWPAGRRVAAFAFLQVGAPYILGPLGEEALPDTQPLIRYDVADCATVNLVAEALAHVSTCLSPRDAMKRANYRGGVATYSDRLHFTTDRLDVSPYDRDITLRIARGAAKTRRITLNRKSDGSHWIPIDWERRRAVAYIPVAYGAQFGKWFLQGRIPEAVGVAFVQEKQLAEGLDVVHESMLWKGAMFVHGSSRIGRVVTIPWSTFLKERGHLYDGFVLFEYR